MRVEGRAPTLDDFVQAYLTKMRAEHKHRFVSTTAGHLRIDQGGEQILYGPNGAPIRVVEHATNSTQIEVGDSLHAVIRPSTISTTAR